MEAKWYCDRDDVGAAEIGTTWVEAAWKFFVHNPTKRVATIQRWDRREDGSSILGYRSSIKRSQWKRAWDTGNASTIPT